MLNTEGKRQPRVLLYLDSGFLCEFCQPSSPEVYKKPPAPTDELRAVLAWMKEQKTSGVEHAITDGRSPAVRLEAQTWLLENFPEMHRADIWIVFQPPLTHDFRLPGRKIAFAATNREVIFCGFSQAKVRMKAQQRGDIGAATGAS